MTKKVKELRRGDHLDGESSPVLHVCSGASPFDWSNPQIYVLMASGNWREFPAEGEVELKSRTVAAKDAEGLTVRLYGPSIFKVEAVGLRGDTVVIGGHWVGTNQDSHWSLRDANQQLEVVDNA